MTNNEAFNEVCELLYAGHSGNDPTPQDTLNRLFRKNLTGLVEEPLTYLTCDNVAASKEKWAKLDIRELAPRETYRAARRDDVPVVIFRFRDLVRLLDGHARAHQWYENNDTGLHDVWVLDIADDALEAGQGHFLSHHRISY